MGIASDLYHQFETLHNAHEWAGLASLFAVDAVYAYPFGRLRGGESIRAYFERMGKAFPDIQLTASLVIEDQDVVVAEWRSRITHTGSFTMADGGEIAAKGNTVEVAGVIVGTVRDGKFASLRDYYDAADLMKQLGAMPSS